MKGYYITKRKSLFNLKEEVLFMSLISHARNVLVHENNELNEVTVNMSNNIIKVIQAGKRKYTAKQAEKLKASLLGSVSKLVVEGSSPSMCLMITLNYLLNDSKHKETKRSFMRYDKPCKELITEVETSIQRKMMFEHHKRLSKII